MLDPLWKEFSDYRLKMAGETLAKVQLLYENEKYKDSINRSHYTIFHCMRVVLALEDADYMKYSSVISHFREDYIKTACLFFTPTENRNLSAKLNHCRFLDGSGSVSHFSGSGIPKE